MKKLLSLPPNLVEVFHEVTGLSRGEYFCTCDPVGHRLGSGGGTAWLLQEAYRSQESGVGSQEFEAWLAKEKRILIHCVPMGAGTAALTEPAECAVAVVREDDGYGTRQYPYDGSQW